jgi:hypothetical protein
LPNSSWHEIDIFQLINRKFFCPPKYRNSAWRLRGGLGKNKEAFLTNFIFYYHLLTREKSLGKLTSCRLNTIYIHHLLKYFAI